MQKAAPVICSLLLAACAAGAAERYVRPPETCTNTSLQYPYGSWDSAATNIQWAVDAAASGETVWVTNGAYCVTGQVAVGNGVILKSVRGWSNTLVYAAWPAYTTRVFHVVGASVLDGFAVSNGHNVSLLGGGGMYLSNATVQNCCFVNNFSTNEGGGGVCLAGASALASNCMFVSNIAYSSVGGGGGGIFMAGGLVTDCRVIGNQATNGDGFNTMGGGIYQAGGIISNCHVAFNYASGMGGGGVAGTPMVTVLNSIISNNVSTKMYGGAIWPTRHLLVRDSIIVENRAKQFGGGFYFWGASGTAIISNCVIAGNSAAGGGALDFSGNQAYRLVLDACRISNNLSTASAGGGGLNLKGVKLAPLVRNCLIVNNTNLFATMNGGGICIQKATNFVDQLCGIINCTIAGNYAANEGGGIAYLAATPDMIPVANCIVDGNRSASGVYPDVFNQGANSSYYFNCCSGAGLPLDQGNIAEDPAFSGAGGWRLQADSPCVNAGMYQDWMTNAVDLGGGKRLRYNAVDMGAYECVYDGTFYSFR